jgi:hypothetical protein
VEFLSHYNVTIHYLPGEKNSTTNALPRLPDPLLRIITSMTSATGQQKIQSHFKLKDAPLDSIKHGYENDAFTEKLTSVTAGMPNVQQ